VRSLRSNVSPPISPGSRPGLLDRPLPVIVRSILILIYAFIPTAYVIMQYEHRHDFTRIISFGEMFQARALPEIRAMKPAVMTGAGFDGQFYAQIALDPTFRRPDLPLALDNPGFRGQRILLPTIAHILGLGRPVAVVSVYAVLNLAFWYALFVSLIRQLPASGMRSFLVLFAIMLTTGTLISVESALTDLPAATLGFISLSVGDTSAALLISLAILTKPTCGLFLVRYLYPFPPTVARWGRNVGMILLALFLPLLWQLYLFHVLDSKAVDDSQFALPFSGWWRHVAISWQTLVTSPPPWRQGATLMWEWYLFEVLALFSMAAQAAFLLLRPQWRNPVWIMGISFVLLFICLGDKVYDSQVNYTRTVLPMTIAFNLLLMDVRSTRLFLFLFVVGNIGLLEGVGETVIISWT
jgi:hypothetical protein